MPRLELTRIHCLKLHNVVLLLEVVQCCTIVWCYVVGVRKCSLLEDIVAWKQITYEDAHEHVKFCCHWFAYKNVHLCVKICWHRLFFIKIESTNKFFFVHFSFLLTFVVISNNFKNIYVEFHINFNVTYNIKCGHPFTYHQFTT